LKSNGIFSSFTIFIVSWIGTGQTLAVIFLLKKGKLFFVRDFGKDCFFAAIAPLGIGSAFPSTLLMAFSLILLSIRLKKA
jgi:hypothetical protein